MAEDTTSKEYTLDHLAGDVTPRKYVAEESLLLQGTHTLPGETLMLDGASAEPLHRTGHIAEISDTGEFPPRKP